jgi:hypothetical protein
MFAGGWTAAGALELVDELLEDVAAFAIAAPPIAAAPTAALVASTDLMFLMSLLSTLFERTRPIVPGVCERERRVPSVFRREPRLTYTHIGI